MINAMRCNEMQCNMISNWMRWHFVSCTHTFFFIISITLRIATFTVFVQKQWLILFEFWQNASHPSFAVNSLLDLCESNRQSCAIFDAIVNKVHQFRYTCFVDSNRKFFMFKFIFAPRWSLFQTVGFKSLKHAGASPYGSFYFVVVCVCVWWLHF